MESRVTDTGKLLYELRVELQEIEPPIWRVLQVPSRTSLLKFHRILQRVMGWTNSHLHLFEVDGKLYGEPSAEWDIEILDSRKITLEKIFCGGKTSFLYEYDLGDSWRHEITLLGSVEGEPEGNPRCTAGARACPPEDCGGPMGYQHLLLALSHPNHQEHDAMLEWVGGKFDPDAFDVATVDRALKRLR
ncbi:MAG: plasmid pRiA4b ORF-3 family protein [Dehalococcoidia bacterium]|jgi:hypothetical protein